MYRQFFYNFHPLYIWKKAVTVGSIKMIEQGASLFNHMLCFVRDKPKALDPVHKCYFVTLFFASKTKNVTVTYFYI